MADEPVEISALNANVSFITDTVSGNLQWFANSLVEKNFITRRVAQGVLATPQLAPDRQAGQLLDSVFTKIRTSDTRQRQWFDAFVDIFSRDGAYQDLVRRLKKGVGSKTNEGPTDNPASYKPRITPADFADFPSPELIDLLELVGMDLRAQWKDVGTKLGIPQPDLEAYDEDYRGNSLRCITKVFNTWHDGITSEYSWRQLAKTMCSPIVNKGGLLPALHDELKKKYM
ncbi:hypothetical protein GBAR_LOCUS27999 [Geodia barretti]|uniref:Death domain-containing protein n=1 Tax=Geodia barretti TaxID=519541 RepID=A0AA35TN68_GEOBA|nr:hypothetical protein GBAR_LOCUS27999 [Geodia barretti]CAI8051090.1 hypothetical protein GBAR_LOCUS27999 [Geodia barretti]